MSSVVAVYRRCLFRGNEYLMLNAVEEGPLWITLLPSSLKSPPVSTAAAFI